MKYKHIVWDWNGTLLDDRWLCIEAINIVLRSRGMPLVSNKNYRDVFCFPVIEYYEKAHNSKVERDTRRQKEIMKHLNLSEEQFIIIKE